MLKYLELISLCNLPRVWDAFSNIVELFGIAQREIHIYDKVLLFEHYVLFKPCFFHLTLVDKILLKIYQHYEKQVDDIE